MRNVVIVVFPGVNLLDVAGPTQVFTTASEMLESATPGSGRAYNVALVSLSGGLVTTTSGVEVNSVPLEALGSKAIDTLLISGGDEAEGPGGANPQLIAWLKAASARRQTTWVNLHERVRARQRRFARRPSRRDPLGLLRPAEG